VTVTGSILSGNTAGNDGGGGLVSGGGEVGSGGAGLGGAVFSMYGTVTVGNSTFTGNHASTSDDVVGVFSTDC
jgi:hypothetical protein